MQSIIALAGVVGLVAASYAPQYDGDVRTTIQNAAFPTAYDSPFRTVDARPSYTSVNNARFTPDSYYNEAPRLTAPLTWSTTKYIRTSAYTTYCPEATTLSFNTKTYTVTAATTLTVTDCYNGCQIVKPLPTTTIFQTAPIVRTTQFETYCPEPTTITFSPRTFTVTQATTLTIPQNVTTTSVFRTIIPVQPTFVAPVYNSTLRQTVEPVYNSTLRQTVEPYVPVSTTYQSPVAPVATIEPFVPAPERTAESPAVVAPVATAGPYVPVSTTYQSPVAPVATIEPSVPAPERTAESPAIVAPVPTTAAYDAIVPPYPSAASKTAVYSYKPSGTGAYYTSPALYTGAGHRVGAGALMAVVGVAALF